jgi:transcriptional regulator with XRE-family HTH domain
MMARMTEDILELRVAILRAGITQRDLADEVDVDEKVLSNYLRGRQIMPAEVREAILAVVAGAGKRGA